MSLKKTTVNDTDDCTACGDCPMPERREFLRNTLVAMAAIAGTLGIARTADAMAALPLTSTTPLSRRGETRTYAVPATDGAQIDRDAEVILVRWQGAVYAFSLSCPHQNTALRWEPDQHRFQCPKHHSKYQPNGEFIEGRATRGMDRFALSLNGRNVVVNLDTLYEEDADPAGWAGAMIRVA